MVAIDRKNMTLPNALTLMRILLAFVALFVFFYFHNYVLMFWVFLLASLLDYIDGWYARRFNSFTGLGVHIDPIADKILITAMFLVISISLKWHWFYFLFGVMVVRELTITFYRIFKLSRESVLVPASWLGKLKALVQYIVGNSIVFYLYISPGKIPEQRIVVPIMLVTVFITIDSGLMYLLPSCEDGRKRSFIERLAQWILSWSAREV